MGQLRPASCRVDGPRTANFAPNAARAGIWTNRQPRAAVTLGSGAARGRVVRPAAIPPNRAGRAGQWRRERRWRVAPAGDAEWHRAAVARPRPRDPGVGPQHRPRVGLGCMLRDIGPGDHVGCLARTRATRASRATIQGRCAFTGGTNDRPSRPELTAVSPSRRHPRPATVHDIAPGDEPQDRRWRRRLGSGPAPAPAAPVSRPRPPSGVPPRTSPGPRRSPRRSRRSAAGS
jgi:hypothetical protein